MLRVKFNLCKWKSPYVSAAVQLYDISNERLVPEVQKKGKASL